MAFGGRSQYKMSDETFDFICTECAENDKIVEAVRYCNDCYGYCCQPCVDGHKKYRALKDHKMVGPSQGNQASGQQPRLPEFPVERCSIHKGKVLNQYCDIHDDVGCEECFRNDHKSCNKHHIHSVPDMIDTLFNVSDSKRTHGLLKDMIASMEKTDDPVDTQLSTLKKARTDALGKVDIFQKALETILRSKADSTRNEVEKVYKQLEGELLDKQQSAGHTTENLKTLDDKLTQSEGNRAQRFVCDKVTQRRLKEADNVKNKHGSPNVPDVQIEFIQDQSLMEYIKALPGIGQVQKPTESSLVIQKQRKHPDLYKIKRSEYIDIELADDSHTCSSHGSCLTEDDQLLVTDITNKKIKRIDIKKMSVIDYCSIDSYPLGICCISRQEAAVACQDGNMIQFISIITNNKITPTRQLKMSHVCHDIAFNDRKLYVTDNAKSVYVYMSGKCLHTVSRDNAGNYLFNRSRHITFNASGSRMYVGGWDSGLICLDGCVKYISSVQDTVVERADGVCTDSSGNVFVVGCWSRNVVQYSEDGEMIGEVVKSGDGLSCPWSVSYHPGRGYLFVTMFDSNVVKMYELE